MITEDRARKRRAEELAAASMIVLEDHEIGVWTSIVDAAVCSGERPESAVAAADLVIAARRVRTRPRCGAECAPEGVPDGDPCVLAEGHTGPWHRSDQGAWRQHSITREAARAHRARRSS